MAFLDAKEILFRKFTTIRLVDGYYYGILLFYFTVLWRTDGSTIAGRSKLTQYVIQCNKDRVSNYSLLFTPSLYLYFYYADYSDNHLFH